MEKLKATEFSRGEFDIKIIDKVIKSTMKAIEESKNQIYDIAEGANQELSKLEQELRNVHKEVCELVDSVDQLEHKYRRARNHLAHVSKNFRNFSELDIKQAYEDANQFQLELMLGREREQRLRQRRDELQIRMRNIEATVAKAEEFVTQVGAVLGYLSGDLANITDVLESAHQKQLMGVQIIQSQEEERKRVAREIHDGPAQLLANVVLRTELCERFIDTDVEKAKIELKELKDSVRQSLTEVRKIIFDLRPMALDDLGLLPTLRKYLVQFEERNSIKTELKVFGKEENLEPSLVVTAFRVVQESLNNVAKHAKATQVVVNMEFMKDKLNMSIKDNGVGFDKEQLAYEEKQSYGLMGMQERLDLLDGRISIKSDVGKGTRVSFSIPNRSKDEKLV